MSKSITTGQQAFLDAYRYSGMVKEAAAQAGCSRELHYGAMRTSETYREAFALVQRDLSYELEEEARRRAVDGVKIPVIYQGKVIGYDIRYSDALLIFLLEANGPEKFGGIQKELARNKDGFCVRWDRDGTGRPRRSAMHVPLPPQPPRPPMPPRPPRPPVGECSEPVTYAEWAAARGCADFSERGPIDPERLARWVTGDDLGPVEWVPEEAGTDLVEEGDPGWESDESDGGFCVRWEEVEPDQQNDGAAPQPSEDVSADVTRPGGPGWVAPKSGGEGRVHRGAGLSGRLSVEYEGQPRGGRSDGWPVLCQDAPPARGGASPCTPTGCAESHQQWTTIAVWPRP